MKSFIVKNKIDLLWMSGFLLLNIIIKIAFLNVMEIGHDEPFSIFCAHKDVSYIVEAMSRGNNPPLFEIILHYWVNVFGDSVEAMRALPTIFSCLTVLVLYKIGKDFFNIQTAIIACTIFTFSTLHIHHAHNIRVYSLFTFLSTLSMYSFFHLIRNPASKKHFVILALANVINIYGHFLAFVILFIQGVSVLFFKDVREKIFKKYVLNVIITILAYLPYIGIMAFRFVDSYEKETFAAPDPSPINLYGMLWKFSNAPFNTVMFLFLLVLGLSIYFIKKSKSTDNQEDRKPNVYTKMVIFWFIVPYLMLFALSYITPVFIARYIIFISIAYYLTIGIAVNYIATNRWVKIGLMVGIAVMMIFSSQPNNDYYSKRGDTRSLVDFMLGNEP
ncbi:glycosyltransferase family 39 protein [Paracrocinitomix mangrovi]|uniref:glycosyltransferase family 39 protein n=1 Tax=Paracrocinitomix mangrovi TaxID=2862509 RepID=UPI001C8ECAE9|nr:glycosyltransferase family 39 protein [Paracrocinitomix mangrovi]UKN00342.1 glycosyltransferase family 39 protein [Paracrocinitomix mangrovi]